MKLLVLNKNVSFFFLRIYLLVYRMFIFMFNSFLVEIVCNWIELATTRSESLGLFELEM